MPVLNPTPPEVTAQRVIRRRPADISSVYGKSTGGPSEGGLADSVLSRPGWQGAYEGSSIDRAPSGTNDTLIQRQRGIMYRRARYQPPGEGGGTLSWTDAGPARDLPTTRFNRNWRPIVGGAHQYAEGQHTNLPTGQKQVGGQLKGKSAMVAGRQNRLTVQRYRGQSYSQTTSVVN